MPCHIGAFPLDSYGVKETILLRRSYQGEISAELSMSGDIFLEAALQSDVEEVLDTVSAYIYELELAEDINYQVFELQTRFNNLSSDLQKTNCHNRGYFLRSSFQ